MLILNSIDVKKAIKCVTGLRLTDVLKKTPVKHILLFHYVSLTLNLISKLYIFDKLTVYKRPNVRKTKLLFKFK